jgi:beta-lactamase regulating signal transducer with metallopeptidase domain
MRVDTANRSFGALFGASLMAGMVIFCGAVGCVLVGLVAAEVASDGLGSLSEGGRWTAALFVAVVGAGALVGICSFFVQLQASRRLSQRVAELSLPADPRLASAATGVRLRRDVALVDCDESFSFAYGALTPRIVVSRGLVEQATDDELAAVLEHERYHVRNLDPLKVLFARALPPTFFYLPALRLFEQRYIAGRELAADRVAVRRCGRRPLAGALFKVVRGPQWPELGVAAAVGGPELLDIRISQLETGAEPRLAGLSRAHAMATVAAGLALGALFAASVASFGGLGAITGDVGPLDLAGAFVCAVPWAVGAWLAYRWLQRRAA